jgi:hypothetical protein
MVLNTALVFKTRNQALVWDTLHQIPLEEAILHDDKAANFDFNSVP